MIDLAEMLLGFLIENDYKLSNIFNCYDRDLVAISIRNNGHWFGDIYLKKDRLIFISWEGGLRTQKLSISLCDPNSLELVLEAIKKSTPFKAATVR